MSRTGRVGSSLAALLAAACLAAGGAAFAQESGGAAGAGQGADAAKESAPGASTAESAEDFSEEDLQKFAAVQSKIMEIGQRYRSKVKSAEGSSEMQELQQSMQKEMVEAVRTSGLDVGTYNSIAKAARDDPALQKKLRGMN